MAGIFQSISDFFSAFGAALECCGRFFVNLFKILASVLELFYVLISWVPLALQITLVVALVMGLLFKVLGRNSNDDN